MFKHHSLIIIQFLKFTNSEQNRILRKKKNWESRKRNSTYLKITLLGNFNNFHFFEQFHIINLIF